LVAGLRALGRGLRHVQYRGYIYIWGNVLWFLLSLPIITAPAAWAGLVKMSSLAYRGPSANVNDLWEGFRENLRRTVPLGLLNALFLVINITNLTSYSGASGSLADVIRGMWVISIFLWFGVQFYMWPLYFWMETPTLRGALRNAGVMMLLNPLFTVVILLAAALVIVVSIILTPAWALLMGGALASIANSAVIDRLQAEGFAKEIVSDAALADESALAGDVPDDTM
jgi:uncharacterized membrane protein YesL